MLTCRRPICAALTAALLSIANATTAVAADFTRPWQGVYFSNPDPVVLTLELEQGTAGTITGTASYQVKKKDKRFGVASGSYKVRGRYDASTGIFTLSPSEWIDGTGRNYHFGFQFLGLHDPKTGTIGGIMYSGRQRSRIGSYFAIAPASKAKDLVKRAPLYMAQPMGVGLGGCGRLERWLSLSAKEYPDVEAKWRNTVPLVYNLFEDEHFASVYKKPFDELSTAARGGINRSTMNCSGNAKSEELRYAGALSQVFRGQAANTYAVVVANRAIRGWHQSFSERMGAQDASLALFRKTSQAQADAAWITETLFPSEQQNFAVAVDQSLMATANKALNDSATAILAATPEQTEPSALSGWFAKNAPLIGKAGSDTQAQVLVPMRERVDAVLALQARNAVDGARGYEGAATLSAWPQRNSNLLQLASPAARSQATSAVNQRYSVLLADSLAAEPAPFDDSMSALEAIAAGNAWYQRMNNRYRFATTSPAFQAQMQSFNARRGEQIEAASIPIVATMLELSSESEVDRYITQTLPLPGDLTSPAGKAIVGATNWHKYDLRRANILGPDALAEHKRVGNTTASNRAPTAVEMYDALTRFMNGMNAAIDSARGSCDAESRSVPTRLAGCYLGFSDAAYGRLNTRITAFRKYGCDRDSGTYVCTYHLGMQVYDRSTRQNAGLRANDPGLAILDGLMKMAEHGETATGRFGYNGTWVYLRN